jgi:putative ABC transport system permease protein
VAAVIAMVAINEGAKQKALEQIQQMGLNNIRIRAMDMTQEEIRQARQNLSFGLNDKDLASIQMIPTVKLAVPIREISAEISYQGRQAKGRILGTRPQYQEISNYFVKKGRFVDVNDLHFHRRVCVLGASIKHTLFGQEQAIGRKIYLGSEVFTVVGVMEGKNLPEGVVQAVSSNNLNNDIYIPLATAQKRFRKQTLENELSEISIMVNKSEDIRITSSLISQLMEKRHNKVRDYEIVVPEELLQQSRQTQKIFDLVMVCIASISLIVGGIGIMNIMMATVTERFREIGIRRAIGASRQDILKQFLLESLAISILGGVLGVIGGWAGSLLLSSYTGWLTVVSPGSIVLGFGVSTLVGLIFGIYPAWKASLLDPIKALNSN